MGYGNHITLDVFTMDRQRKVACIYDSDTQQMGAAHDIKYTEEMNGWKEISFTLPVIVDGEKNWRAQYMTNEYELRVRDGSSEDWFRIAEPTDAGDGLKAEIDVTCPHCSAI